MPLRTGFQDFTAPTSSGSVSNAVLNALIALVNRVMSSSVLGGLGVMSVVYASPVLKVLTDLLAGDVDRDVDGEVADRECLVADLGAEC